MQHRFKEQILAVAYAFIRNALPKTPYKHDKNVKYPIMAHSHWGEDYM